MARGLCAAILIVSDTAAADRSTDKAETALRSVFAEQQQEQWTIESVRIVPDDAGQIQDAIAKWADPCGVVDLVITTGGTGFAPSDRTPEAVSALLDRQAPGLVHAMLSASLRVTPFAAMARPVAGMKGGTVVVTLPGSPKGAMENLQSIIKLLPHACRQTRGEDSRSLHAGGTARLEKEVGAEGAGHGVGPQHQHHSCMPAMRSSDTRLGPCGRLRCSPYRMLAVDEALALIRANVPGAEPQVAAVDRFLVGAVLAEDIMAREDVPAFRASIVDGYAVVVPQASGGDMRGVYPVVGVSHAAASVDGASRLLHEGQIARVTTGAPVMDGANAVVMVEDSVFASGVLTGAGVSEEGQVQLLATNVHPGANIREPGSDVSRGTVLLLKGEQVTSSGGELGLLASQGISHVLVFGRPVVGVLSTGDELVPHDHAAPLKTGQVRDTNRPVLLAAAASAGYPVVDLGIARDTSTAASGNEGLEAALRRGLSACNLVVTTGGVSMGELDLVKPTVERCLGGTIHFGRVNMKPGKPTTFASVPATKTTSTNNRIPTPLFSLPGNPASALVAFTLLVLPALDAMTRPAPEPNDTAATASKKVQVALAHDIPLDPHRPEYQRAVVFVPPDGTGRLEAASTGGQSSSRIGSLRGANALLCLPSGNERGGRDGERMKRGEMVDALIMGLIRKGQAVSAT